MQQGAVNRNVCTCDAPVCGVVQQVVKHENRARVYPIAQQVERIPRASILRESNTTFQSAYTKPNAA